MKTKIYIGLLALLTSFIFNSCASDEMENDKGSESLALSVSSKVVALDQLLSDREAFRFEWTAGTNHGTNSAISYTLEMDVKGNNFAGGFKKEIGTTDSRLLAFTHKGMNDLVAELWESSLVDVIEFEARVTAVVLGHQELAQVSPVITFQLTTYKERYLNLWMIGGATPGGWRLEEATALTSIEDEPNGFVWEGPLVTGELKFLLQRTSFTPSFNKDENAENKLIYRESDSEPDVKFVISKASNYKIKLNLSTLDIEITDIGGAFVYASLWMIGDATPGGWSLDNATKLTKITNEPNGFSWEGELKKGDLKFVTQQGDFYPSFGRDGNNPDKLIFRENENDGADNKFAIKRTANYRIKLNLSTLDIVITNLDGEDPTDGEYWIAGAAAGGSAIAMTQDASNPAIFTYNGELQDGTFHIAPNKEDTEVLVQGRQIYQSKYAVTFNAVTKELKADQVVIYNDIWAMGEAISGDFDWAKIKKLTQSASNKNEFVYDGNLGRGQIKFPLQTGNYGGLFIVSGNDNEGVTNTFEGSFFLSTDKGDKKWFINNPGIYKITINTYKKSIRFEINNN